MSRFMPTITSVVFLSFTFPALARQGGMPANMPQGGMPQGIPSGVPQGGMPQGMPGSMPSNMQGNRPGGPMNQQGGMGMPGDQSRGGGMARQQAQRDNDGWRGPGHHGRGSASLCIIRSNR